MEYKIVYSRIKNVYIQVKNGEVIVKAPRRISKKDIEKIVKEKEKQYADEGFKCIVENTANELIKKTGLVPSKVRIRDINYAWGSCSAKKNITISYKLIRYSKEAIRYVILHELCHLKYMNHSKEFWRLVETYMPNYKETRKELK